MNPLNLGVCSSSFSLWSDQGAEQADRDGAEEGHGHYPRFPLSKLRVCPFRTKSWKVRCEAPEPLLQLCSQVHQSKQTQFNVPTQPNISTKHEETQTIQGAPMPYNQTLQQCNSLPLKTPQQALCCQKLDEPAAKILAPWYILFIFLVMRGLWVMLILHVTNFTIQ